MGNKKETSESVKNNMNKVINSSFTKIIFIIGSISILFYFSLKLLIDAYTTSLNIAPKENINVMFSLNDAFIGIIATLMGVMVTFVIGYQILNAIEINKKITEVDIKVENKGNALNNEIQNSIRYMNCKIQFDRELTHITLLKKLFSNNNTDLKYLNEAYELVENYLSILTHVRDIEYLDISKDVYANLRCCKASISFAIQLIISEAINDNSQCSGRYANILNLTNEIKDSERLTPFNEYLNITYDCLKDKIYDAHKMQTTYL